MLSPRSTSSSSFAAAAASPTPTQMIEGPLTLVSTLDSDGLEITYTAVFTSPSSGIFWSIPAGTAIKLVGATNTASVKVQAVKGAASPAPNDQQLRCSFTQGGTTKTMQIAITVVVPISLTTLTSTLFLSSSVVRRTIVYQINTQFQNPLRCEYSYTNSIGENVTVRVVNLLASEKLMVRPPAPPTPPVPAENVAVNAQGKFTDTLGSPRGVVYTSWQDLFISILPWNEEHWGIGNMVAKNVIDHTGDDNVVTARP